MSTRKSWIGSVLGSIGASESSGTGGQGKTDYQIEFPTGAPTSEWDVDTDFGLTPQVSCFAIQLVLRLKVDHSAIPADHYFWGYYNNQASQDSMVLTKDAAGVALTPRVGGALLPGLNAAGTPSASQYIDIRINLKPAAGEVPEGIYLWYNGVLVDQSATPTEFDNVLTKIAFEADYYDLYFLRVNHSCGTSNETVTNWPDYVPPTEYPVITQQPTEIVVVEPNGGVTAIEATHPGVLKWRWEASSDNGKNWVLASNLLDATGVFWKEITLTTTAAVQNGILLRCRVWEDGTANYVYSDSTSLTVIPTQSTDYVYVDAGAENVQISTGAPRNYVAPFEVNFQYYITSTSQQIVPIIGNTDDFYGGKTTGANWMIQLREEGHMRLILMGTTGNVNVDTAGPMPEDTLLVCTAGWDGTNGYLTVNDVTVTVPTDYTPQATHGIYAMFDSLPILEWSSPMPLETRAFTGTARLIMVETKDLISGLSTEYKWQCRNEGDTFWTNVEGPTGLSDVDLDSINTDVLRLLSTTESDTRRIRCIARPYGASSSRHQIVCEGYLEVFEAPQPNYYVGHWMDMPWKVTGVSFTQPFDTTVVDELVGYQIRCRWDTMEPTKGNYDFTRITDELIPAMNGKKFIVFINEVSFTSDFYVPQYLMDEGYATVKRQNDPAHGTTTLRWRPYVVERYLQLAKAIDAEFHDHPQFAGIATQETALGMQTSDYELHNYTPEKWRDALINMSAGIATIIHPHQTHMYLNFLAGNMGYMWDVNAATLGYHVLTGGPDILPGSYSLETHVYPRTLDYKVNLGGRTFISAQNDSHRWSIEFENNSNNPPFFTADMLMDYNEGVLPGYDGNGNTKREIQVDILIWSWIDWPLHNNENDGTKDSSFTTEHDLIQMAARTVVAGGDIHVTTGTELPTLPEKMLPGEVGYINNIFIHEDIGNTDFRLQYNCDEGSGFVAIDQEVGEHDGVINSETIHRLISPIGRWLAARVSDGLVAQYLFDEGAGTVVRDSSGNEFDLVINDAASYTWVTDGVKLSGAAASAINGLHALFETSGEYTLEEWLVVPESGLKGTVAIGTGSNRYSLANELIKFRGSYTGPGGAINTRIYTDEADIPVYDSLFHTAHTFAAGAGVTAKLDGYINGVEGHGRTGEVSEGMGLGTSGRAHGVGDVISPATDPTHMTANLVTYYDRVLTPAEVQQNYDAGPVPRAPVWLHVPRLFSGVGVETTHDLSTYVTYSAQYDTLKIILIDEPQGMTMDSDGVTLRVAASLTGLHDFSAIATSGIGQDTSGPMSLEVTDNPYYYHDFTSGDLGVVEYTRASNATYEDVDGNIVVVYDDEPQWPGYDGATCNGLLLEGAGTNVTTSSENCMTVVDGWYGSINIDEEYPSGVLVRGSTSTKYQSTGVSVSAPRYNQSTGADGLIGYAQMTLQAGDASAGPHAYTSLNYEGAWVDAVDYAIDGPGTLASSTNFIEVRGLSSTEGSKLSMKYDALSGNDAFSRHYVYPGGTPTNTTPVYITAVDLKFDTGFSSYIPTTTVPVTRAESRFAVPFTSIPHLPDAGVTNNFSVQFVFRLNKHLEDYANYSSIFMIDDGTDANSFDGRLQWYILSGGRIATRIGVGGSNSYYLLDIPVDEQVAGTVLNVRFCKRSDEPATIIINDQLGHTTSGWQADTNQPLLRIQGANGQSLSVVADVAMIKQRVVNGTFTDEELLAWD